MFVVQQSFMGMGSVNWFQLAGLLIDDAFPSLPGLVHCDLRLGNLPPKPFHSVPFSQSGPFLDGKDSDDGPLLPNKMRNSAPSFEGFQALNFGLQRQKAFLRL